MYLNIRVVNVLFVDMICFDEKIGIGKKNISFFFKYCSIGELSIKCKCWIDENICIIFIY